MHRNLGALAPSFAATGFVVNHHEHIADFPPRSGKCLAGDVQAVARVNRVIQHHDWSVNQLALNPFPKPGLLAFLADDEAGCLQAALSRFQEDGGEQRNGSGFHGADLEREFGGKAGPELIGEVLQGFGVEEEGAEVDEPVEIAAAIGDEARAGFISDEAIANGIR